MQNLQSDVDKDQLENPPGFDKGNWPDLADPALGSSVYGHYANPAAATGTPFASNPDDSFSTEDPEMSKDGMQGEGNYEADRRYRRGVKKTLEKIGEEERSEQARSMTEKERREARAAEVEGKRHSRR